MAVSTRGVRARGAASATLLPGARVFKDGAVVRSWALRTLNRDALALILICTADRFQSMAQVRDALVAATSGVGSPGAARECLQHAIAIDPGYALPHSVLGGCFVSPAVYGMIPAHQATPRLGYADPHAGILHRDRSGGAACLSETRPGNASPIMVQFGLDIGYRIGCNGLCSATGLKSVDF
jgi:hypothetical protein